MSSGVWIVLGCVAAWLLVSGRLSRWSVTAPIVLALLGLLLGSGADSPVQVDLAREDVQHSVEVTLALILFSDASRISVRWFEQASARIAARLLGIGLPASIGLGLVVALILFPHSDWAVLAVLAAALAPTDAALGAAVMDDERIPERVRNIINVESGLNDGLATPFVLFFLAIAAAEGTHASVGEASREAVADIALAIIIGGAVGWVAGKLLTVADGRGWSRPVDTAILPLVVALLAYFGALAAGGNGFVAAFAAGVTFGTASQVRRRPESMLFIEQTGIVLSFFVWFVFGASFVRPAAENLTWQVVLYALLSLTVVRMVPVALALARTRTRRDEVLLIGWLGPRGLASIVFALIAVDELIPSEGGALVARVVTVTVALSVLLHGLTAGPLASAYSRRLRAATPDGPSPMEQPDDRA